MPRGQTPRRIEQSTSNIEHHRASNIEHRTPPSIEHRTSNIEHRLPCSEHRTLKIEPRTSNIEHRTWITVQRTSDMEHRTSNIEHRKSDIENRTPTRDQQGVQGVHVALAAKPSASLLEVLEVWRVCCLVTKSTCLQVRRLGVERKSEIKRRTPNIGHRKSNVEHCQSTGGTRDRQGVHAHLHIHVLSHTYMYACMHVWMHLIFDFLCSMFHS